MPNLNFGKTQKFYSQCEMGSPLHEEMADITSSNFTSGIKKTTSKEIEKLFYSLIIAFCQCH